MELCIFFFVFFFFVFSPLFFSFPDPPRRVEKNSASKRDCTEIRVKIGYTERPDFAPAAAGWGKQNQAKCFVFFSFDFCPLFFSFPQP
jgi:hypothetical protein